MNSSINTEIKRSIWQIIQDLNKAWIEGHPENLENYFHNDMIIVAPDFQEKGNGKEACVESYKNFTNMASISNFKESDPKIEIFGFTAIVSYSFEISYEMNNETFQDTGRDLFVFIHENKKWQAVWRTVLPLLPINK